MRSKKVKKSEKRHSRNDRAKTVNSPDSSGVIYGIDCVSSQAKRLRTVRVLTDMIWREDTDWTENMSM